MTSLVKSMISCEQYDYIEIVCLYHYPIELTMKSGERINGVALDTKRNDQKQECIEVKIDETKQLVILEDISKLTVSVKNPHFSEVTFQ